MDEFKALVVKEKGEDIIYLVDQVTLDQLSKGEVIIKVAYSSINYKDALAVKKGGGVIRDYPMIPGIDLSGTVVSSSSDRFIPGQEVLVTGFQVGMTHTGGLSEYACIPADWVVPLPKGLSLREAMVIGTAGFTAAISIHTLEKNGMNPNDDIEILVTGASGGVGSIAIKLLSRSGYKKINGLCQFEKDKDMVKSLGAAKVFLPEDILPEKPRPLDKQKFHYVLDVVGGEISSALLPQIFYGGSMSMCGNAGGIKLDTTVMHFILRGITLLGIDSVNYPRKSRDEIWAKFAGVWNFMKEAVVDEVSLNELDDVFLKIQSGLHVGRTIVKIG